MPPTPSRVKIRKTYKLFINGEFPRTESGRFYPIAAKEGAIVANACRGSRKDLRNAVVAARKALSGWSGRTGYNRGQILYRMAEICESRASELEAELKAMGATPRAASREVTLTVDRLVYYAGWSDKFAQLFGTVNPVAGPYYNFSVPEPTGVIGIIAPETPALLGLVSRFVPAIIGGNTAVVVASETRPLAAITLAEILATSDLPPGVVNFITGFKKELSPWLASHMDVNAIDLSGTDHAMSARLREASAENVKRVVAPDETDWSSPAAQSPYAILDFLEIKTVWHPMGM